MLFGHGYCVNGNNLKRECTVWDQGSALVAYFAMYRAQAFTSTMTVETG